MQLSDLHALYHGNYTTVANPDLALCSPRKDFGQGFYVTSSREQAENFARIVTRRARRDGLVSLDRCYGIVSAYEVNQDIFNTLASRVYESANADWLHCVVAHRRGQPFVSLREELVGVDIIAGKVANDQTNATILAYLGGLYGEVGTARADEMCVSLLLPERLQDQLCFRSPKALSALTFTESERVWL